jgi:IclR family KDG regulon transcriptional repressor
MSLDTAKIAIYRHARKPILDSESRLEEIMPKQRSETEQLAHKQASSSVLKALDVVEALVAAPSPLTLTEIAKAVDRPLPTTHRLLRTLELRDWVESVEGRYRLTLKLFDLGITVASRIDIVAESRPRVEELCREVDETINVSVRSGGSAVYVLKVESPRSVRLISQLGMHVPLHATAMGKVLLAFANPDERADALSELGSKLEPRTENTIVTRKALEQELAKVARRGWGVDNEEYDYGLTCVAAPIYDRGERVTAAISAAGPTARMTDHRLEAVGRSVTAAAADISKRLGYAEGSASRVAHITA